MPIEIEFSLHSLLKIELLMSHGIDVSKEAVEDIIRNPDRIGVGYKERLIAQKGFDDTRVLRVVYESLPEKIYVVTVYPGRRSRYEKD
ncbi:DUF4258 domain-containing protein [Dissulfurispira thermophila]|uniref:DUF4258 domain-containing protein n=2 Tax=root TaxID=1 RepID=A0A7G1GZP9_9BACT|nr:DUF4258 domain-containing protein [Dissulfurispira thermophila]BCB95489.1 DUF4258 domain-containing protein [Dissulfurispira thermophila]